ncbi:hypothetical protein QYE76_033380 [Lolium multiflorum]|uniref:Transposase (putative) gypsy type domain-containing protein n=1 Tax=Lolium multiflorum TaxID=4521 RepID=A0AAD8VJ87_LOLMU|nr:hypothetical protein QYE76_033380 [Lolium multiflorum]
MIFPHWSFMKDSVTPKPDPDERVLMKALVERGLSLPCSEFFLSVLTTYGLQLHNICPNSYLLLSNFMTLCEGHLGIRPDIRLWQFFFRVKKEMKDKAMVNCGSVTFMLRPGKIPNVHQGLPKFVNKPPEELDSWSLIPALAQYPELDKAARRISRSTLSHPQQSACGFSENEDQDACEDYPGPTGPGDCIGHQDQQPVSPGAEEDPEDDDEEEEQAPKKAAPRTAKRPRAKVSGSEAGASGEASAKKAKTKPPPLDSKKAERERLKLLANAGKGSRPLIPRATSQKAPASRVNTQKQITKYLKVSPVVPPITPTPPSTSHPTPHSPPHEAQHSPDPAAQAPPKVIPVSNERGGGSSSATRRAAPEGPHDKTPEEAEVNSQDKAEAPAHDAVTFPANFGDTANLYSTPKAYSHKFFHKLMEAEKWDLEQDLRNSMMSNAWGKADVESSEIQLHKKEIGDFFDQLLVKRKQTLHYELDKNISLQRCVTLSQAEDIQAGKERIAELEKQLAEAQGASSSLATTSSELESLRSAYQDLETKFAEADKKREQAEKHLAEKKSELLQKEAYFAMKRKVDIDTLQKLQNEVHGLRNYMTTAEKGWDLLNANVMEPLGYDEERCNQVPRDDLIRLAGDDCKDLISASRKICHNLNLKDSRTCDVNDLIKKMDVLPELVVDLQASSARGAA